MKQTLIDIDSKIKDAANCQKDGNFALAASIYQNLLEQQPSNAFLYNKLAQVKAQSQDWQEAIESYQKALELKIESPFWTYKNLGDALREVGQIDQAISSYQQAIAIDPNQPTVYDSLGQVQSLQDKCLDAIASYQKAIELGIKNPFWTYQNLGDALTKENRLDEAKKAFQQAQKFKSHNSSDTSTLENNLPPHTSQDGNWLEFHNKGDECFINEEWEQAIALYAQAIKLNPNYFWSFYNSGRAFAKLEKWNEAIFSYQNAIKVDPDQLDYVNPLLQEAEDFRDNLLKLKTEKEITECLQKAELYFQQQQWDRAISLYQKVINIKPEVGKSVYQSLGIALIGQKNISKKPQINSDSKNKNNTSADEYYKIADEYFKQGKLDEAEVYHHKAIEANPNFAVSFRALGDIYKQKNDFPQAAEYYTKSVELKPNYYHAYQRLAFVLHQLGNIQDAISAYGNCLKIKPSDTQIQKKLGELIDQVGDREDAETISAASPDEYFAMGEKYYQQGQLKAALEAHQKAISLNPNLALSYRALGDIYTRTNQIARAIDSYSQAVKLKPDYYYGYQKLGNALQNQGELQKAISAYRRALEIKPDQQNVKEKLTDLLQRENMLPASQQYNPQDYPRILVIAPIKFNQQAGGGVTMGNLFRGWPQDAIAQIHSDMFTEADYSVCSQYFYLPSKTQVDSDQIPLQKELLAWCETFKPDIIFARPIDHPSFYWWLPQTLAHELNIPFVTNVMDDWPARYEAREDLPSENTTKSLLKQSLQHMFNGAAANIGISPQMCEAYQQRYGNQFVPFHNCIDVAEWSKASKNYEITGEFSLLYLGVVTEDKELWSLKDIRDTVLTLREQGYPINMQIYSAPFCRSTIEEYLEHKPGIEYAGYVHPSKLPQILSEADLLVLPINFDEASLKYVGYSIQTKVPEYMASGTPILAYGPSTSPNIAYASKENWGIVVDKPDKTKLATAILRVLENLELRSRLGKQARDLAFRNHDAHIIRNAYRQLLADAAFVS